MKHNDKASQDDNSARLDALLSDFLDRDIVAPAEPEPQFFSRPTSAPLGDLFPEVSLAKETTSAATSKQAPAAPVIRTEVWEATNRTGRLPQSRGLENLAADRLEMNVDSVVEASQAASGGKKLLFSSIAVILVLAAGMLIRQSRRSAISQQLSEEPVVNVSPSEIDPPVSLQTPPATTSTPEVHSGTLEAGTSASNNRSRDERPATVMSVPESSATASRAPTSGVSQAVASNAARLQRMPAPTLGRSTSMLGTIPDLASLQPAQMSAPLPLPPVSTAIIVKDVVPDVARTTTAIPAVPITKVQPTYPELARRMNVTGTVHVEIVVDKAGKVISAKAIDGSPVLRGSAELAVKQWRFKPSTMNGKPVTGSGTVSIVFSPDPR